MQVSGLELVYDFSKPEGQRLVAMSHDGRPIEPADRFEVAAVDFIAEGGDLYDAFPESEPIRNHGMLSDAVVEYFRSRDVVRAPPRGRQRPVP